MPYGYNGKILRVDLSTKEIKIEEPDDIFYRMYMGGSNFGLYYMLKELEPGIDPFDPDNLFIIAVSVATGVNSPGFSRYNVITKSPLTGGFGDSQSGGYFGAEFKFAGYDALIVKGKSKKPCYIFIENGKVEINEAEHIWGKTTDETAEIIKKEKDDNKIRTLSIGKGGENLVRYACVISDSRHANGRIGSGSVMGSKNLKAVAVRGTEKINVFDKEVIKEVNKVFTKETILDNPATELLRVSGTPGVTMPYNIEGMLPTFNFRTGTFKHAEDLSWEKMEETLFEKAEGCYACPIKCKRILKGGGKYGINAAYGGPEYETITAFGSNCGVHDLEAVAYAHTLANGYSIDSIGTGSAISFAMECYENGILTKEDTDGIDLKFGNTEGMLKMIEKIANRDGFGDLLAEGVKIASEKIGKGSEKFAMHVKGQSIPFHEPRAKGMLGFSYAFNPIGADHVVCEHDTDFDFEAPELWLEQIKTLGLYERYDGAAIDYKKVRMYSYLEDVFSFHHVLCICVLATAPIRITKLTKVADLISAITGWEVSLWELMKIGERRLNLAKCFNAREGIDVKDDVLPKRFFEPIESGAKKGNKIDEEEFKSSQKLYYRMRNWDKKAIPTKAKLYELDLKWVIEDLEKNNIKLEL